MNNIFLTGISGFAGSNLVKYFSALGNYVIIGHSRAPQQTKAELANAATLVEDYSAAVFNAKKINTIVHLAGIAHDLSNRYQEQDYYRVNFDNTKKIFDDFIASDATRFIFLSSIKAVVENSPSPALETVAAHPGTPYGKSKRLAEEYILSTQLPPGKMAYILRPCMIHGSGNKGNLNLLYQYVNSGMPYPLGAFNNQRSFLNIDNFNFIIHQLHEQAIESGIYHLADNESLSTRQLYEVIAQTLDKPARIWNIPEAVMKSVFAVLGRRRMLGKLTEDLMVSNKKILQAIGKPLPVSVRDGIRKTILSFQSSPAL